MTTPTSTALRRVVQSLPGGGEVREGQLEMAEAIERAIDDTRHVVVQAGTGTGKSLAYLVPAVLSGKRVVVATATKALQDQLAAKDLPFLQRQIGRRFEFAVLKGRSNYFCPQQAKEVLAAGEQGTLADAVPGSTLAAPADARPGSLGDEVRRLVEWGQLSESGDRGSLDFEPTPRAWSLVSVSADECPGARRCPSGDECRADRARAKAAAADVVVVNMHLYGAHLASGGMVLPEHEAVVFDEAHELEDVLAESLGFEVSPRRLRGLGAAARSALSGRKVARQGSDDAAGDVFDSAERLEEQLVRLMDRRVVPAEAGALAEVLALAAERMRRLETELRSLSSDSASGSSGADGGDAQRALRVLLSLEKCRSEIEQFPEAGEDTVVWVEGGEQVPRLRVASVDVSAVMTALVLEQRPTVLTSATVPAGLSARLGIAPGDLDELDVGSPFPYEANALLYCAVDLPDRRRVGDAAAEAAQQDEMVRLIEAAGGRTLALFTSRRALAGAVTALRPRLEYRVLAQDDLPKPALLEAFAADRSSCLFATTSFWQGVDVPGPSLSLVIIDRIPFPRPDDPLISARRDRAGSEAFKLVDLPRAATLLAQGTGRLIRSASDRGVVAVLDPRLAKASYRWDLVRALPPMRRTRDRSEVEAFLAELRWTADPGPRADRPGPD